MAKVTTLFPAFGGNRTNAQCPGYVLGKCDWIGVPFAGGMPEVPHLQARSIVVNDKHRHIINCARAVRDYGSGMIDYLNACCFHPDELERAQKYCEEIKLASHVSNEDIEADVAGFNGCHFGAAVNYFVSQWMGRSGQSSTGHEFEGNLSTRWTSSGGDSNTRFRSAVNAIADFASAFRRCSFTVLDYKLFMERIVDKPGHGIYCDSPWPDAGAEYLHSFNEDHHNDLALHLDQFNEAKICLRFGEHDLIRSLYPESKGWKWKAAHGRTQGNGDQQEWFITRRCERQ